MKKCGYGIWVMLVLCSSSVALAGAVRANYNSQDLMFNGHAEFARDWANWNRGANGTGSTTLITDDSASFGTKCYQISVPAGGVQDVDKAEIRSSYMTVIPGEPILLRISYKTQPDVVINTGNGLLLQARFQNSSGGWLAEESYQLPVTNGQWVTRDFRFNIASNPNVARLDVVASLNRFGSASGTVRFDDIEVYSARTYNPENMFINGGAEWLRDFGGWTPKGIVTVNRDSEGTSGTSCFKMSNVDDASLSGSITQLVTSQITPGEPLLLTFNYQTEPGFTTASGGLRFYIYYLDKNLVTKSNITLSLYETNGSWYPMALSLIVPTTDSSVCRMAIYAQFREQGAAQGTVRIDDIQLCNARVYNRDVNRIGNGDAEATADFEGWTYDGPATIINRTAEASACFEMNNTSAPTTASNITQVMPTGLVLPGERMLLKFKFKTLAGFTLTDPNGLRVQTRFLASNGTTVLGENKLNLTVTDGQWETVAIPVAVDTNSLIANIDINASLAAYGVAVGQVRFDDFELYNLDKYDVHNAIQNNDAENPIDWKYWYAGSSGDAYVALNRTESASTGTSCFEMYSAGVSDTTNRADFRTQTYGAFPGEPMLLRFKYKTESGFTVTSTGGLRLQARFYDGDGNWKSESNFDLQPTDGQWVDAEYEFNVGTDPSIFQFDLSVKLNDFGRAAGTVKFDDFEVYAGCVTNTLDNLFLNGDAENPVDFIYWGYGGFARVNRTDSASDGTSCYEIDNLADPYVCSEIRYGFAPISYGLTPFCVAKGDYLVLRFAYKTMPGFNLINPNGLKVQPRFFDGSFGWKRDWNIDLAPTDGEWKTVTYPYVVGTDTTIRNLDIRVTLNCFAEADGMVRFDDFQMFSRRPQIYPNKVYAYKGYSFPHFNALGNEWKMSEPGNYNLLFTDINDDDTVDFKDCAVMAEYWLND